MRARGRNLPRGGRAQRGQSLIEMALVLTLLILLFAGIADLGRAFNNYIILTNAAREGARMGSHYPDQTAMIIRAARQEAEDSGVALADGDISIEFPRRTMAPGSPIRVVVTHDFDTILGGIFGYGEVLTLSGYADMVIFGRDL